MKGCDCGELNCIKDSEYGWICVTCLEEMRKVERETDWDTHEANRRERIAEANEY